jgi:uncharacterized damage-inducible protein DinB
LLNEYRSETQKTLRCFEYISEQKDFSWSPQVGARGIDALAGHIARVGGEWAIYTVKADCGIPAPEGDFCEYPNLNPIVDRRVRLREEIGGPWVPASKGELIERFERQRSIAIEALEGLDEARWEEFWLPGDPPQGANPEECGTRYDVFREFVLNHMIHHRAQLAVYLGLLGGWVPGVYGPSRSEWTRT